MSTYTIKDLEKITGVKAHTIRIWEKRYNIVCPMRTKTNIRCYRDTDLKKLLNVSILNKYGYKISQIASLSPNQLKEKVFDLTHNTNSTDKLIEGLFYSTVELDEAKFEHTLSKAITKLGFEKTFEEVVYPFMVKLGILWQTGSINPAQEHFISNLIRQKLIVAIDSLESHYGVSRKKFLLFLPEGELHELGLLYYNFLLKKNGFHVIYLGQSLPICDLRKVVEIQSPDYLLTILVQSMNCFDVNTFLKELSLMLPAPNIFLTGEAIINSDNVSSALQITKFNNSSEFKDLVKGLSNIF